MIGDMLVYVVFGLVLFGPVRWAVRRLPVVQRWRPHRFKTIRPFDRDAASFFAPQTVAPKPSWLSLLRVRLASTAVVKRLMRRQ